MTGRLIAMLASSAISLLQQLLHEGKEPLGCSCCALSFHSSPCRHFFVWCFQGEAYEKVCGHSVVVTRGFAMSELLLAP